MSRLARTPAGVRRVALGLLLLAFVAGALGGIAGERLFGGRRAPIPSVPPPAEPLSPDARGAIFPPTFRIARQLDLTPDQRRRIAEIMAIERAKADSLLRAVRPALQARYDSTSAAIRELLNEEQRARFDSLRESRRERARPRMRPLRR